MRTQEDKDKYYKEYLEMKEILSNHKEINGLHEEWIHKTYTDRLGYPISPEPEECFEDWISNRALYIDVVLSNPILIYNKKLEALRDVARYYNGAYNDWH